MGLRHGFHLLENDGRSSVNEATSGFFNEHQQNHIKSDCVGPACYFCHQKVGHVHLAVPIVGFLRWHYCSITKALLAAPFSSCHFFQKVLKYLVLGVLRRLALTFRPGELHPRALDYQQATPHGPLATVNPFGARTCKRRPEVKDI